VKSNVGESALRNAFKFRARKAGVILYSARVIIYSVACGQECFTRTGGKGTIEDRCQMSSSSPMF
jgi:hypothetical protein